MGRYLARLLGGLILACTLLPAGAATDLPLAADLPAEAAQAAKAQLPLIVIYSRKDCKYCETVKRDYLKPLANHPQYRNKVLIRQVNQDGEQPLLDFNGRESSHAAFAAAQKIKLVPVVAFYGPGGRKLAEPIIGARLADFYNSYLDEAIQQSGKVLRTP